MWMWWSDVNMADAVDGLVGCIRCVNGNMCVVVLRVWKYVWWFCLDGNMSGGFVWMEICVVVLCGWKYVWWFCVVGNMCGVFVCLEICVVFFCGRKYVWWMDSSNGCNAEEQLSRRSNLRCSDNMLHKSYLFSFTF